MDYIQFRKIICEKLINSLMNYGIEVTIDLVEIEINNEVKWKK